MQKLQTLDEIKSEES